MTRSNDNGSLPESAMGGASDAGAHGMHPASAAKLEDRSAFPDEVAGDAAIERRRHRDSTYDGPERRVGAANNPG